MSKRPYDESDLKEVYDNIGADVGSWDDLITYLKGPAAYDADFAKDEIAPMVEDIQRLKDRKERFTQDYRRVWELITGEKAKGKPQDLKKHPLNPIQAQRMFEDMDFPTSKREMVRHAQKKGVSDQVAALLEKVEDDRFESLGRMLEEIGDQAWDHD
jgi:hypothetical protein